MATYTDNYQLTKPTYAEQADVGVINSNMNKIDDIMHSSQISLAPAYDSTKSYAEGDVVMYELLMYKCISPTTGVWDASKWERTTASESGGGGSAELDILGEASGAVASFADGASAGLAKCIAEIVPKQAGSGTPSPDNVRAISGYTAVKVDVAGKNLCRVNTGNNVVVAHCKAGQTYTFSIRNQGNCGFNLKKNTTEGEQIVRQAPSTDAMMYQTFTADEDYDLFLNGFGSGGSSFGSSAYDYQLELGSDATTYEAYAGSTTTTPLGQTVYGGQLNVLTGELLINKAYTTVGALTWSRSTNFANAFFFTNLNDSKLSGEIISSHYETIAPCYASVFGANASDNQIAHTSASSAPTQLFIRDDAYTTTSDFTTNRGDTQIVFELATPQTYQLTPQEVNSLLGQNNISADTGDIDIVYVKASAPIQPNPTGTPTATLSKLGIEGTVFELPSGGGGGGSSETRYSITEQKIGTVEDENGIAKDLYERMWVGTIPSYTSSAVGCILGTMPSDYDEIIDIKGSLKEVVKAYGTVNGLDYAGWRGDLHINVSNQILLFATNSTDINSLVGGKYRIIIQYTKITD